MERRPVLTLACASLLLFCADEALRAALPQASFPLTVSPNSRYLIDGKGVPFLVHGHSPWEIARQLTKAEAERYLERRRQQGINGMRCNYRHRLGAGRLLRTCDVHQGFPSKSRKSLP